MYLYVKRTKDVKFGIGFNGFDGTETNCGIAHILGILLMNSYNTDIFLATTIICSLSTLKCNVNVIGGFHVTS